MARFVVKRHRPWQWAVSLVIVSMIAAGLTWLLLDRSHWSAIEARSQDNHDRHALWAANQNLEKENRALRERVLMLERTTSLDRQTAVILQEEIKSLQERIYDITGELEFYQGVMTTAASTAGLDVHGIRVRSLAQPRHYDLKVILTNVVGSGSVVEGMLEIAIAGRLEGRAKRLALSSVNSGHPLAMEYKFRNFARFESNIVLPEGFKAERVFVALWPQGKRKATINKAFDWPLVAAAG